MTTAQPMVIALAGNPNVGKSTLFNALTGGRQHVGNWPGKTIEKKEGWATFDGREAMIVDLPGTYSLAAYSAEEIVARDYLLGDRPSAVIAVADAANLERNLYLVCQLIELGASLILVLNMSDTAANRGLRIDTQKLSAGLGGIPVVEMVGSRGVGMDALRAAILRQGAVPSSIQLPYDAPLEAEITALQAAIERDAELVRRFPSRWLAIKLLENDAHCTEQLANRPALLHAAQAAIERVTQAMGDDPETILTDRRYGFIGEVVGQAVARAARDVETASDRADRIITHRIWGLPIFLLLMWTVFQITANVSAPLIDWVDGVIAGPFTRWVAALIGAVGLGGTWIESLLVDGVIAGVGGVLVFVPLLMLLYITIGLLEDTGYMARAAFVMDWVMRRIGLHGKSFLPLLVGFGCTVPAIYATRTLESERDRKLTGFLSTFMSCGARLPVYVVFAGVFFGAQSGTVIFGLYLLGILIAIGTGLAFKYIVYRGKVARSFVMELPPYRMPNASTILTQTWERTRGFIRNAATIIMASSVIVWMLTALPADLNLSRFNAVEPQESAFGAVSGLIAPAFAPAGFGTWQAAGSLISGFVAKEVVVGTMSQIYGTDAVEEAAEVSGEDANVENTPTVIDEVGQIVTSFGEALVLTGQELVNIMPRTLNLLPGADVPEANFLGTSEEEEDTTALGLALSGAFTPLSALAFMVFVLLYTPCMTATAAMRHEFGGRWTLMQMGYATLIAWGAAVIVYQGGLLLGWGG
ncbi:MAG: ferrous iron transport protein B [Chloroflexi bacterium]|nr:ferrous iron transport protein B [Chloroflexota bacterium]